MKKIAIGIACVAAVLALASCQKTCVCSHVAGYEKSFTEEEVDAAGTTCAGMQIQAGVQYYLYCEWR